MGQNVTINKYLNGYPNRVGNKNQIVVGCKGPTSYLADGVTLDPMKGVTYIHSMVCSGALGAAGKRYDVVPIFAQAASPNKFSDMKIIFVDMDTGLEPANATDLSAATFRVEIIGTP